MKICTGLGCPIFAATFRIAAMPDDYIVSERIKL
jgi:hypothetical protein